MPEASPPLDEDEELDPAVSSVPVEVSAASPVDEGLDRLELPVVEVRVVAPDEGAQDVERLGAGRGRRGHAPTIAGAADIAVCVPADGAPDERPPADADDGAPAESCIFRVARAGCSLAPLRWSEFGIHRCVRGDIGRTRRCSGALFVDPAADSVPV